LFPLELGADLLFPAVIAMVFLAVVFLVVIWFVLHRTGNMSDEFSKESKARFDAIKPTSLPPSTPVEETQVKLLPPSSSTEPPRGTPSPNLFPELQDIKTRVVQLSQDYAALKETETTGRNELSILKNELKSLRDQLEEGVSEIRKMRTSMQEQDGRFQDLKRSVEEQFQELKKQPERHVWPTTELPQQPVAQPVPELSTAPPTPPKPSQGGFLRGLFGYVTCSNCGRRLRSQDQFCDSCGQAAPTQARK
jgi:regulator of replication initiation timing